MSKKRLVLTASLVLSTGLICSHAIASDQPNVTPFTDTVTVNLQNMPSMKLMYLYDNDVLINGPTAVSTGTSSYQFTISSNNLVQTGDPSMYIQFNDASGEHNCKITFRDGPWLKYLMYSPMSGSPHCDHLQISDIYPDKLNEYHIDMAYAG